jgi:hypothetical protein
MKKQFLHRLLSLTLSAAMLGSVSITTANASSNDSDSTNQKASGRATLSISTLLNNGVYTDATAGNTYTIANQTDMNTFVGYVNGGKLTQGVTFQLTGTGNTYDVTQVIAPATITEDSGTNSPKVESGAGFQGTFDGGSNTINVNLTGATSGMGLFGYLAPTGLVENLTVTGSVTNNATTAQDAIGGVVGYNSGTINHVTNKATVSATGCYNVGGIAGFNNAYYGTGAIGLITDCGNQATVTGFDKVGGITGENAGTIQFCYNDTEATVRGTDASRSGVGGMTGRNGNNNTAVEVGIIRN